MSKHYKQVAKELKIRYLFGKWAFQVPIYPTGGIHWTGMWFVNLDGWITDPKEVERIIRERGMEL